MVLEMAKESFITGLVGILLDDSRCLPVVTGQSGILVYVIQVVWSSLLCVGVS